MTLYPSVRAARASHTRLRLSFVTYSAAPARCEPHRLLSFAQPSLILRSTFAYPSLILRSTFAEGSEEARRKLGEISGGRGCVVCTFKCYKSAYYNMEVR